MDFLENLRSPRHQIHYEMAHRLVPGLLEEYGAQFVAQLLARGAEPLLTAWRSMCESAGITEKTGESDFSVIGPQDDEELCNLEMPSGRKMVLVFLQMPEVRAPLECEKCVFAWDVESDRVRYFTLEAEMSLGTGESTRRVLCEWSDGNHLNHGLSIPTDPYVIKQVLSELLAQ